MGSKERIFDTVLREEVRRLNLHLPKNRKALRDLLSEDPPTVPTVEGGRILMRKSELEDFASSLPEMVTEKVRLPLVLLRRTELGPGAFTVLGDKPEEYAISHLVGSFPGTFEEFRKERQAPTAFYKPQVSGLMRRFHSLIVIGFGVPEDLRL